MCHQTLTFVIDRDFVAPHAEILEFMGGGNCDSSLFFGAEPLFIDGYARLCRGYTKLNRLMSCALIMDEHPKQETWIGYPEISHQSV